MKAYNHLYETPQNFNNFVEGIGLQKEKQLLVRVHSSIHSMEEMQDVAKDIKAVLPNALIIGCSSSMVVCEGDILSDSCLVSITEFDDCKLRMGMFSCVTEEGKEKDGDVLCRQVSEELIKKEEGLMLVFFPLSYYKTAKFVSCMNRENKGVKMVGGVAYIAESVHHQAENLAYVLSDTTASANSMAAVMMISPKLSVYENVVNGVDAIGRSYEVTKVHEHFVDEIEGVDAATWYEDMLGKEELAKDPSLAGIFPLVYEGTKLSHNVVFEPYEVLPEPYLSEKRNRINLFSEITEGMKFSLGYFDPQKIIDQMNALYAQLHEEPIEVVFIYDCLARMWMLHDCASWEVSQFKATNMSGAMMAGEIGYLDGKNVYANSTFVVAGLSEDKQARILLKEKVLQNIAGLQYNNVQMINYLLTIGNKQLNRQINEQYGQMQKAMFYNANLDLENQTKYLVDRENEGLNKAAVFSLKNERVIRLFLGQGALQEELKKIYAKLNEDLNEKGLRFYSYGECALLIAAGSNITDEAFVSDMKEALEQLNSVICKEFVFSYECAIVMHEEEALSKLDEALEYAEKNKIPFVLYSEVKSDGVDIKEEMRMLQIIKEALVQDRVIPYFQGIYDNRQKSIGLHEALIRIEDAEGNMYYPDQFLPVAKEYGLYEALSVVMVKKVMQMFLNQGRKVSINLNVRDIYDREMIRMIFRFLEQEKHPENFVFELVESEEIQDYTYIQQFADSIHEYGARIAIDDFGSGFCNMMHVIRIDADIIKIDGEIIKEICHDENCREFLEMINNWCAHKKKEVIAEYVENEAIQQIMEEIGITHSQGYYYARPMSWENCEKALAVKE
ncbi:MAG: EAL domain-containing protein [Lachnospiraceae bacterium]|nr:EAL domain-containing protein [Lachnospiraceae bacterium]